MATPVCWIIIIFGVGYVSGFVIYIMIQFDSEYSHRNQRCWHYTTWLVTLPAVIGINQRFHPKYYPLRLFYGLLLLNSFVIWQIFCYNMIRFMKYPVHRLQISAVSEIIESDFRLSGSTDVLSLISFDQRVIKNSVKSVEP